MIGKNINNLNNCWIKTWRQNRMK